MNSALKPVLPQAGVSQPGGQASPAKGNVANVNHAVGHPQGAQNSLHHGPNSLVGQNLTQHAVPQAQLPSHAAPSMAPVSANMAQMAQNMSHHGNLSHVTQNSTAPPVVPPSPSKSASTSSPLSLVQDKANTSQPLALTRTPEKKEPDSTQSNGTVDSPKPQNSTFKPQNSETNKDKQDIAKILPSTPKPPEKANIPATSQKSDSVNPVTQAEGPVQPKVATANEPPEKSPAKPIEIKPTPTADVAPTQSDNKLESANENQLPDKPQKEETPENTSKSNQAEEKKEEPKPAPSNAENKKCEVDKESKEIVEKVESPKKQIPQVEPAPTEAKVEKEEKVEEVKAETKINPTPTKAESKPTPKSTLKLATVATPMRKRRQTSPSKIDGPSPAKKSADADSTPDARTRRNRTQVQLYQSPTPELAMATKLSASAGRSTPTKPNEDKLIVFYKNEFLAVRNAEGSFYVCQAMQNVYRTTRKIKIRWLSQDKSADPSGETYKPDFYDVTDMECVLTTLSLSRAGGGTFVLKAPEHARANSILERALNAEKGEDANIQVTEEHPDGLDLSLYTDESQLEKKSRKRKSSPRKQTSSDDAVKKTPSPAKKSKSSKRSPKRKSKTPSPKSQSNRKSTGTKPVAVSTSKTATAVTEKSKSKSTPAKRTPAKVVKKETPASTPSRKGRRAAARENKSTPVAPTPSTSTGKTTRTPRKPPAKK